MQGARASSRKQVCFDRELWACTDSKARLAKRIETALGISPFVGLAGPPQRCDGLASVWPVVELALCPRDAGGCWLMAELRGPGLRGKWPGSRVLRQGLVDGNGCATQLG